MADNVCAPIIHFDFVIANGALRDTIQIELAANTLQVAGKSVEIVPAVVARIRCDRAAAQDLIAALQNALDLPQSEPQKPGEMN